MYTGRARSDGRNKSVLNARRPHTDYSCAKAKVASASCERLVCPAL